MQPLVRPSLLTFDIFGTVLDWRRGLRESVAREGAALDDAAFDRVIDAQGRAEDGPFRRYADMGFPSAETPKGRSMARKKLRARPSKAWWDSTCAHGLPTRGLSGECSIGGLVPASKWILSFMARMEFGGLRLRMQREFILRLRGHKAFKEEYPQSQTVLLYRGKDRLLKDDILCIPCSEFLLRLIPNQSLDEAFV